MTQEDKDSAKKKYMEAVAAEHDKMKKAVEAVSATEAGKEFLRFLHRICGYAEVNLVVNRQTGEVDTVATTYNECRRGVYIQVRNLVPVEVLKQIEFPSTNETEEKK
jgi:nitrogen fixation/metabolism regulation signal transduction histidine kinase